MLMCSLKFQFEIGILSFVMLRTTAGTKRLLSRGILRAKKAFVLFHRQHQHLVPRILSLLSHSLVRCAMVTIRLID